MFDPTTLQQGQYVSSFNFDPMMQLPPPPPHFQHTAAQRVNGAPQAGGYRRFTHHGASNAAGGKGNAPTSQAFTSANAITQQQHSGSFSVNAGGSATSQVTTPQLSPGNNNSFSASAPQPGSKEDVLQRTVHLRFLPTGMKQGDLAAICNECGPFSRVRICGGQNNSNQNWIYGFVEFTAVTAAAKMMKKSGMELNNGPNKPPLRLKCHVAREPIVDRVFHDADPSKGFPCQFGHGAFANRTLKEALDSYFSLVNKNGGASHLKDHVQQLQLRGSPGTNTPPPSSELKPLSDSSASSVNGRTPTLPPSPQVLPPQVSGFLLTPPSAAISSKLGSCMNCLDAAMRSGAAFAQSMVPTHFFEAMGPLHNLHETLNTMSPVPTSAHMQNNKTSAPTVGLPCDDQHANAVRSIRISAYIVAAFLHKIRGSLPEMLPCIIKAMDVIASVTMAAVEKPSALQVDTARHDDDDDAAFLSALSLVHVSQPSAVISHQTYDASVQHQCFLINALLALGFGIEKANALIARCAYTAARRRAVAALDMRHPRLEEALHNGGVHNLYGAFLPHAAPQEFAAHFFLSYVSNGVTSSALLGNGAALLPPQHAVAVFPIKRGSE